ncbi:hypothetical protein [Vampirovibrio chlorellavorus]|uniref:hypothetical protein n=1 Tax=Vampirovibrio chlorellavorus TaxID=758823 RepID=UPI0026EDCD36|nr:hypothetical protein [Vampirovibrio chlorellavorus]
MKRCVLLLSGFIFLQGCANFWEDENPAHYTRDKAAGAAMEKLVRYADLHHVPVYQFRGPYFMESLGGDFPTYRVCFKIPNSYYYCHDHLTGIEDSGLYKRGVPKDDRNLWLEKQPG